ncbi:MAG: GDP-mannose 4,6-dehydratase, partial [Patescibacteria group bacterium]
MKIQKKIFVTGGAGFIGSNFIRYMYKKYPTYVFYNLDLLTYAGNLENLADIEAAEKKNADKRYFFIKGDICDAKGLEKIFGKHNFDMVVNFAAESHVDRSLVDSFEFIKTNILGTHILLNLVHKLGIRFVHISTDEVYGDVPKGHSTEESSMRPSNPYSASKAAADHLVQSYMRSHKIKAVLVRGSNNFGPYQYPEKLIPLIITNLLEGHKIPIHGNGKHVRTWIHVE